MQPFEPLENGNDKNYTQSSYILHEQVKEIYNLQDHYNFHFIILILNTCSASQVALSALEAVKPLPLPQEGLQL